MPQFGQKFALFINVFVLVLHKFKNKLYTLCITLLNHNVHTKMYREC